MRPVTVKQKIAILLLTVLLSVVSAVSVYAVQSIDLEKEDCSITLKMVFYGRGEKYLMSGGEMSLYLVGPAAVGDTGYYFDTGSGRFAGTKEAKKISKMNSSELSKNNADLASALMKHTAGMKADQTAVISKGEVSFKGLRPGLYLIAMTKADDTEATITPFLMSVPDADGNYNIVAKPKPEITPPSPPDDPEIPETGQLWWPVPLAAAAGALLIVTGIALRRRDRKLTE